MPERCEPLPEGSILFHAGFHKTGTTAVQGALASSRKQLADAGVLYPSHLTSHHRAAMAVTERTWGWGDKGGRPPQSHYWDDLSEDVQTHKGRVVISSESFVFAKGEALARIVDELGADRLQAVFTLRPFAKMLSSSYQQYLKYGLAMPYGEWLENVFANPPKCPPSPNFWRRNDHALVMSRWVDLLGPDHVTLMVLDDKDRGALFRNFEGMLDLPEGTLVPDPEISASNRSMTAAEAEMLRLINASGGRDLDWPAYEGGVRRGAIMRMVETRKPAPDEPMISTPEWAVQAASDFGAATAERVTEMGLRVVGDVSQLANTIPSGDPSTEGLMLPVEAAAGAVLGGVQAAERVGASRPLPPLESSDISARDAASLLADRLERAGRWRAQKARRAVRRTVKRPRRSPAPPKS